MVDTSPKNAPTRGQKAKASRLWWVVHQWVGLKLSVFMSFVLLTGTLAVFSNEIDWLIHSGMRVNPSTLNGDIAWVELARATYNQHPDGNIQSLTAPVDKGFAAFATVTSEGGERRLVYAHPSTGVFQGDYNWVTVQRVLRFMHRHLFLPTAIGVPLVSALSIFLLISIVTSFVVYKKWWRGFFKPIRFRDARTALGDVHRIMGVWSLWFVALMALTGLWYLAESTFARAPGHPSVQVEATELSLRQQVDQLELALHIAQEANPELNLKRIVFPTKRSGAFIFQGDHKAMLVRPRSNAVWVEAATSEVKLLTDGRELNMHQRISEMADPLHFGYFAGVWTKIIWFTFGVLLTALSITGVAIYSTRLLKSEKRPAQLRSGFMKSFAGMGFWLVPSIIPVLIGLTFWIFAF